MADVATFHVIGGHPKLQGEFLLVIRYPQLDVYKWKQQNVLVESFHIPHLRAYGQSGRDFAFEAGRRCPLGVGNFPFKVSSSKENISKTIDLQLEASKNKVDLPQIRSNDTTFVNLRDPNEESLDVDVDDDIEDNYDGHEQDDTSEKPLQTTKLNYVSVVPGGPVNMKDPTSTTPYTEIDIQSTVAAGKIFQAPSSTKGRVIGRHAAKAQNNSPGATKKPQGRHRNNSTSSVSSLSSSSASPRGGKGRDSEIDRQLRALYLDVKIEAEGGDPNVKPMLAKRQLSEPSLPRRPTLENVGRQYSNVELPTKDRQYSNVQIPAPVRRYSNVEPGKPGAGLSTSPKQPYVNLPAPETQEVSDMSDEVDLEEMLSSLEDRLGQRRNTKSKPSPLSATPAVYLKALYDSVGQVEHELSFSRGDTLVLLRDNFKGNTDWWLCELCDGENRIKGYAPANYVARV